jgi:hypothetical protein
MDDFSNIDKNFLNEDVISPVKKSKSGKETVIEEGMSVLFNFSF